MSEEELKPCRCGGKAEVGISRTDTECYAVVYCTSCREHIEPILIPIFSLYVDGVKLDKIPSKKAINKNQESIIEKTQEAIQAWERRVRWR